MRERLYLLVSPELHPREVEVRVLCTSLSKKLEERLRALKLVLVELEPAETHPFKKPVADCAQIVVVKLILGEVELCNKVGALEASQHKI